MSRQVLMAAMLLAAGALAALAMMNLTRPAVAAPGEGAGPYTVVAGSSFFVLCDTVGGKAWILLPKAEDPKFAWMPVTRLETDADVRKWKLSKTAAE